MMRVRLLDIAHARSGDKGDTANVGIIALRPEWYRVLDTYLTRDRVAAAFRGADHRRGRTLRSAEPRRTQFPVARRARWRRHVVAQDRRAGQSRLDGAAPHGARRAGRSRQTASICRLPRLDDRSVMTPRHGHVALAVSGLRALRVWCADGLQSSGGGRAWHCLASPFSCALLGDPASVSFQGCR